MIVLLLLLWHPMVILILVGVCKAWYCLHCFKDLNVHMLLNTVKRHIFDIFTAP